MSIESSLDEKSRELLAEIERERIEKTAFTVTPAAEAAETEAESEATEVFRPAEREPVATRPTSLERTSYGDTDLDIPSFLRQPNRDQD